MSDDPRRLFEWPKNVCPRCASRRLYQKPDGNFTCWGCSLALPVSVVQGSVALEDATELSTVSQVPLKLMTWPGKEVCVQCGWDTVMRTDRHPSLLPGYECRACGFEMTREMLEDRGLHLEDATMRNAGYSSPKVYKHKEFGFSIPADPGDVGSGPMPGLPPFGLKECGDKIVGVDPDAFRLKDPLPKVSSQDTGGSGVPWGAALGNFYPSALVEELLDLVSQEVLSNPEVHPSIRAELLLAYTRLRPHEPKPLRPKVQL